MIAAMQPQHTHLPEDPDNDPDGDEYLGPSKSQRKRESTALQDLGTELIGLSRDQIKKIEMPERLREAILEAQRITANGAIRRQRQFIGKLMRDADIAPIQAALDEIRGVSAAATARQHALENLRTRLLADETVVGEIAQTYPGVDITQLRQLRRNALKEQQLAKPPRAFREIFRILRELQNQAAKDAEDAANAEEDQ
jgi:ribosome-associated protein